MSGVGKELFLSYGREPEVVSFVTQLKHDLERSGFTVWLDTEDIPAGCDWHGAIGTGLDQCRALIAVITKKYISSRYCTSELYTADGDQKLIFPVIFEDVDFSSTQKSRGVKYVISGINWTMFRVGIDDYNASLSRLIQGMKEQGLAGGTDTVDAGNISAQMAQIHLSPHGQSTTPTKSPNPSYGQRPPSPIPPAAAMSSPSGAAGQPYYPQTPQGYPSPYMYNQHTPTPPHLLAAFPTVSPPQMQAHGYYPPHPPPLGLTPTGGFSTPNPPQGGGLNYAQQSPPNYAQLYPQSSSSAPLPLTTSPQTAEATPEKPPRPPQPPQPASFKVGMKLEAVDRRFPYFICVATVMDRSESSLLIHFDGWSSDYDYWCPRNSVELHPAGWCLKHGWDLYPPHNQGWDSWEYYLEATEATAANESLFTSEQLAPPGSLLFRTDMRLEALDRQHRSIVAVATVADVKDGQLLIHFDGWTNRYDYWCRPDSLDIHPAMWCGKNKRQVQPPKGYSGHFKWSEYLIDSETNPAPAHLFTESQRSGGPSAATIVPTVATAAGSAVFKTGMKLEAKDRLNPTLVCVATVADIKDKQLLIHFDGWSSGYDYWCSPESTDIHPKGWCEDHGRSLQPPNGVAQFQWDAYLKKCSAVAAPSSAFTAPQRV